MWSDRLSLDEQNAREYTEHATLNYLLREFETDIVVDEQYYNQLCQSLAEPIRKLSEMTRITGFTKEDLESFCFMKIHQVLRQNAFDTTLRPSPFFIKTFNNMFHNIHKMNERAIKRGHDTDLLDYATPFEHFNGIEDESL